jgi:predicted transposase YdaD
MEQEYKTEFPESMKEEMVNVCNWNEVFEERGMIKGREAGILEGRQEGAEQNKLENALRMIAGGKLTYEEIASYTDLPLEKVQELAAKKSA